MGMLPICLWGVYKEGAGMEQRITKIKQGMMSLCLFLLFFMLCPVSAKAEIKTGGIAIQLNCWEEAEGKVRIQNRKQPELLPNEELPYVMEVHNLGSDAWVRIQIQFLKKTHSDELTVNDTWLYGIGKDWVKRGNYWYYTKPLKRGERIDFCRGIRIPNLTYLAQNTTIQLFSRAEAIQKAHITPDFSSENPFKGYLIEGSAGRWDDSNGAEEFKIQYANGADTVVFADKLFSDITEIMPGDKKTDMIVVRNSGSENIRIHLKENGTEAFSPAMSMLQLKIKRKGKEIYSGPFMDQALKNGIVLGSFSGKTEEFLEVELILPMEAKNETAFQKIQATFLFSAEAVINQKTEDDNKKTESTGNIRYPFPDPAVEGGNSEGGWKLIDEELHHWEYWFANGEKARNGWFYLYNPYSPDEKKENWFCFNEEGLMQFGWIKTENENWYFCHEKSDGNLGILIRGWHHDQDDKRDYYLDPITGIMQSGWRLIDGNYYYFTPLEETKRQNWFWNTGIGRWLYDFLGYRTYGSMFKMERTPDGYYVDESGVWNGYEN